MNSLSKKNILVPLLIISASIILPKMLFATDTLPGELVTMTADAGDAGTKFMNLFTSFRGLGIVTIFFGIIIAGVMAIFGQNKYIFNVLIATAVMFGMTWIIEMLYRGLQ